MERQILEVGDKLRLLQEEREQLEQDMEENQSEKNQVQYIKISGCETEFWVEPRPFLFAWIIAPKLCKELICEGNVVLNIWISWSW